MVLQHPNADATEATLSTSVDNIDAFETRCGDIAHVI